MRDSVHNFTGVERPQDAARGADPQVLEFLKSDDLRIDPEALVAELDLPDDQKSMVKAAYQNLNMAEQYRESAERRA